MKHGEYPRYSISSFSKKEESPLFYITPLEQLVSNFKGIDKPHAHTFYLIMWISQGSGTHTIDFKTYQVGPQQLYFLTPGQVHQWNLSSDIKGFNLFFDSNFYRSRFGNRLFQYPFFHSNQYSPLIHLGHNLEVIPTILRQAHKEYTGLGDSNFELLLSYLHIILENAKAVYHQKLDSQNSLYYNRIRQYEELIENQFLSVRKVQDYATQMNISPNHLNAVCKEVLGKTASQLYQERIVTEAQRLLLHTDKSAKEISFMLGFDDNSYFNRFFKQHTGVSPLAFKANLINR